MKKIEGYLVIKVLDTYLIFPSSVCKLTNVSKIRNPSLVGIWNVLISFASK